LIPAEDGNGAACGIPEERGNRGGTEGLSIKV